MPAGRFEFLGGSIKFGIERLKLCFVLLVNFQGYSTNYPEIESRLCRFAVHGKATSTARNDQRLTSRWFVHLKSSNINISVHVVPKRLQFTAVADRNVATNSIHEQRVNLGGTWKGIVRIRVVIGLRVVGVLIQAHPS
jgi:hypothetical protein